MCLAWEGKIKLLPLDGWRSGWGLKNMWEISVLLLGYSSKKILYLTDPLLS
jgi:hypothetical protein